MVAGSTSLVWTLHQAFATVLIVNHSWATGIHMVFSKRVDLLLVRDTELAHGVDLQPASDSCNRRPTARPSMTTRGVCASVFAVSLC